MATVKVIEINANTSKAKKDLQSLNATLEEQREILIELEKELIKTEQLQATTSKTNLAAQKKLTEQANHLKDAIKDQKLGLRSLNIERRTAAESVKELLTEEANQSQIIKLLDTVTGGYATKAIKLYEGLKEGSKAIRGFNIGLKGTKTALIATGIGAFIVALGTVVAYWDEIVEFIDGASASLQKQVDIQKDLIADTEFELKLLDIKQKTLETEGKSTDEIIEKKKALLLLLQSDNDLLLQKLKTQLEIEKSQVAEVGIYETLKIGALQALGFWEQAGKARAEAVIGNEDERKAIEEREKELQDSLIRQANLQLQLSQLLNPKIETDPEKNTGREKTKTVGAPLTAEEQQELLDKKSEQFEQIFELEKSQENALFESSLAGLQEFQNSKALLEAQQTEDEKAQAEARRIIAQLESEAKQHSLEQYASALSSISGVIGQETEAGKAIAIAASLVNTYASISGQLKAFSGVPIPGFAIAQAIATGVVGFANVKKIASVKIPKSSGGGSSVGGGSLPSGGGAAAPSFNLVGQTGTNQLAQSLGQNEQQPVQAFVVASQVTTQQGFDNNIVETATLG